jgi:hypothetical protein
VLIVAVLLLADWSTSHDLLRSFLIALCCATLVRGGRAYERGLSRSREQSHLYARVRML